MAQKYPEITIKTVAFSYWKVIKTLQFWVALGLIGSVGNVLFSLIEPLYYRNFFNGIAAATGGDKTAAIPQLQHAIIMVLIFNLLAWAATRIGNVGMDRFTPLGSAKLKQQGFEYLLNHSYTFFANNFTGSLTQKIGRYSRAFERLCDRIVWSVVPLGVRILGTIIILSTINSRISLAIIIWMIAFLAFNYFYAKFKFKYDTKKSEADTKASAVLADAITNHNTIQLFTGHPNEKKTYMDITGVQSALTIFVANLDTIADAVQGLLMVLMEFALFYYTLPLWAAGGISIGTFVIFQSYVLSMGYNMWDFSRVIRDFYEGYADAKEMVQILELPHEIKDIPKAKKLEIKKGEVKFDDVIFSFNETRAVLDKLSFTIKGGEKVALIGPSGAGKSTIVRLLLRLYDVSSGHILIDGQDIQKITQKSLHHDISLVPQDPILFHRSLMENIRYGRRDATDTEVIEAAKLAHCDEFIKDLPKKYETFVGERGIKLSGGERQRVAIARAILKNAPILILDEATSSLDSHSESLIQEALERLMKGKTTIVIAHRLSTIQKMDRIVVIKDGHIEEEGSHHELLKNESGLYHKLWALQAGGFIVEDEDAVKDEKEEED
jgi:ATP-binding cassette subfamily B protein